MNGFEIGMWSFPILITLIFVRMPIGLAMLSVGLVGTYLITESIHVPAAQLKHMVHGTFSNYSLSIIPLFLLMGQFATLSGMSKGLFKAAETWLGHKRGGVAMSAIGACAGFGAICGSSLATAATMGQVALPELKKAGYSGGLSTAVLAAGGTLGILIPPSVILVIYAILTEQNIGKLFIAAFVPGILAAISYMITISVYTHFVKQSGQTLERVGYTQRFKALLRVWQIIAIFLVVVGGIYLGVFTPTEAAAIGAAATGIFAFLSGKLNWDKLLNSISSVAVSTGMIFLIILGASFYNSFIASTQLPQHLAQIVTDQNLDPWLILSLVLFMYLLFGCFMDSLSMVLLTVPIFYPIMLGLDFGLTPEEFGLWFGILVLISVEVGLITPPVGMNLFVINTLAPQVPVRETFKAVLPFVLTDIIRLVVLVFFPSITLGLVWLLH